MLVLLSIAMVIFMITAALSIEIARLQLARTELRTSTDAAAKAAAEALSRTQDRDIAVARGRQIAAENQVNGEPLQLRESDFLFGRSEENATSGRFVFNTDTRPFNSVRVNGERSNRSASGPIPLLFGATLNREVFETRQQATATFIERDVVLVVDRSGSMAGTKFVDLRNAIAIFVATLNDTPVKEEIGLASYSDQATVDAELTEDLAFVGSKMRELRTGGFTSISRGMMAGQTILEGSRSRDFVERTMIVMTDGLHNRGPEPRGVAQALADDDVVIHTITFGRGADQTRMRQIANIGRGRHFHAENGEQLKQAYREIALTLSTIITE